MPYSVKEVYLTLQGEGGQAGRTAVFLRFTGCNLWTGRQKDRSKGKGDCSNWCDTDFVGVDGPGGGKFLHPMDLAKHVQEVWGRGTRSDDNKLVVCTGGEPLLQLDKALVRCLHQTGFKVAVETNGTIDFNNDPPNGLKLDWVCVSPKGGSVLKVKKGNELKLVYPQLGNEPSMFEKLEFDNFYLQPKDDLDQDTNIQKVIDYCIQHPKWKLCLQTHKMVGLS